MFHSMHFGHGSGAGLVILLIIALVVILASRRVS